MQNSSVVPKWGRFVIRLCALTLLALSSAFAQDVQELTAPDDSDLSVARSSDLVNETSLNWFVELGSAPTADGGSLTATKNDKQNFRKNAKAAGLKFTERRSFDVLWNGISIHLADASQLGALTRIAGVKQIYPVVQVRVDPIAAPAVPDLTTALAMTGANIAQNSLGYTGEGIKVAVMDTGIDYNHPALGGCFGPGCRVAKGFDFVGDAYDAGAATPVITPDPDPDDCAGHGTHVAGIIGANDANITGVAPNATLYAYRVFGCVGSTDSDIMLAAMERALNDGAQILNMSIGAAFQTWPQYPTAQGADRLVNKGVVVVASIGNSGASGLYSAGAPGVGSKVIGVASVDNTAIRVRAFTVNPDGRDMGYFESNGTVVSPQSGTFPLERTSATLVANDGCTALPDLTGKIALIRRGTCGFYNKALNAQRAHAVGVVLFNNANTGLISPSVTPVAPDTEVITIPVVFITQTDGQFIHSQLGLGPVDLTWNPSIHTITLPATTGGLISSFSSYGLAADLSLKPDISAPGGNIFSTYPLELGGYTSISGTSMASPHTAGIAALYLQAHPGTSSQVMRSILQNTALPRLWFGNPGLGFNEVVGRSGAGLVQADKAILATTFISPGKLSLGESEAGPVTQTLTVRNDGPDVVTYDLSRVDGVSVRNTFTPAFSVAASSVSFSVAGLPVASITLTSGQTVNLDVTISPNPGLTDRTMYGGHIVFTPQGGGQVYRVPYAGFKGNYQSIVGMPAIFGGLIPNIGRQVAPGTFDLADPGETFTLASPNEIPFFLVHLDHQVRSLKIEVIDAVTAKNWQRAFFQEYLSRNSTATGFFALPFDGNTVNGNILKPVPNGTYYFRVTLVKALGDAANPADLETFTSANFVIARP